MNGWESHWAESFHVKDGALACDGSVMSWLSTKDTFANYDLKLEFRATFYNFSHATMARSAAR